MTRPAYYNEFDPYAAQWLRNLIAAGRIPAGDVDDRSIKDVTADDLDGYGQCHFFAGIGGFGLAARLAGVPDDADLWTGGFPCQPFSVAGRQLAQEDDRHLWPVLSRLIEQARPSTFIGENVAGIIDLALDGVLFDLESAGYASRAFVVPACAVNAPHRRDRVWIAARNMADAAGQGRLPASLAGIHGGEAGAGARHGEPERRGSGGDSPMADASGVGRGGREDAPRGHDANGEKARRKEGAGGSKLLRQDAGFWDGARYLPGADGKARRVEPGIRLLAHGVPGRVAKLRAGGNAIVPQVAAEVIRAVMQVQP